MAENDYVTREQFELEMAELREQILREWDEHLAKKRENAVEKKLLSKDMTKFRDIKKSAEAGLNFRELQKLKAVRRRSEIEHFLGYDKEPELVDAYDIAKGKKSIRQAHFEKAKAEERQIKKVLESE